MNRRTALQQIGGAALLSTVLPQAIVAVAQTVSAMPAAQPFTLPALPFAYDALEPYFDAETMHLHHQKHHQAYVNGLNAHVSGEPKLAGQRVEELLANLSAVPEAIRTGVRNQGGGHANHSLFWTTLGGKPASAPTGELAKSINRSFGSRAACEDRLTKAALSVFGSGWAWLVEAPDGLLSIEITANQDTPLSVGRRPLLGIDVWEHAYYLKYQNRRADYLKAYFQVVNWDGLSARFADNAQAAMRMGQ